jgi:hypothetical protein
MKTAAAKAKFHSYGKNKAVSTTSYNTMVKRVADGENDLLATLEDMGRLNVRVVTTGNVELAKNPEGQQVSTKDYQKFIESKLGNGIPNFETHKTITCVHEDLLHIIGANLHGELTESQSRRIMYALHPLQGAKPWHDDLARNEQATKDYTDWRLANPKTRRNNNDKDW